MAKTTAKKQNSDSNIENPAKAVSKLRRPPVVVIMGHIDHGKSTLLDFIRKSNIVKGEAGGITQHLGAYQVTHIGKDKEPNLITFLDTPGHEAFSGIRSRGATVADIAILVVSAEDGVKPQTIEAFQCIKSAGLPYIVAINKIDKPNANIDRTKLTLAENEVYVEGYGGDVPCVPISALTGKNVPELLDMIMLLAELEDLTYNPENQGEGVVIEAHRDSTTGVTTTILIKDGVFKSGDFIVAEDSYAPIRRLEKWDGSVVTVAEAGTPVVISGFDKIPVAGAISVIVKDRKEAEALAGEFAEIAQKKALNPSTWSKMDKSAMGVGEKSSYGQMRSRLRPGQVMKQAPKNTITIPLIIKADAMGSIEGIHHELAKIKHDKVLLKVVHEGIGDISESDLKLADGIEGALVLGFNVEIDPKAEAISARAINRSTGSNSSGANTGGTGFGKQYDIQVYKIIYELTNYVAERAKSLVPKEKVEVTIGQAKILATFSKNKDKQIIGGKVSSGSILLGREVKIMRRTAEIGQGKIRELQQQKAKAQEVREGYEFGAMVESKIELMVGDTLVAIDIVEK